MAKDSWKGQSDARPSSSAKGNIDSGKVSGKGDWKGQPDARPSSGKKG